MYVKLYACKTLNKQCNHMEQESFDTIDTEPTRLDYHTDSLFSITKPQPVCFNFITTEIKWKHITKHSIASTSSYN